MLKKFTTKSKWSRKSIGRELEEGMKEHFAKYANLKRDKRIQKFNKRYV